MVGPALTGEWNRAQECQGAAVLCLNHGFYADAISRSYYAIMHAAKAALLLHGVQVSSHVGLRNRFGLTLVRTGLVEAQWVYDISRGLDERIRADYHALADFTEVDADSACIRSELFLSRMRTLLAGNVP